MKLTYNDQKHQYRIDGKMCSSVTNVAGIPDDRSGLERWFKRTVLEGVTRNPDLITEAAAVIEDKWALSRLAEKAINAARGNAAADRGTRMHKVIERANLGLPTGMTPDERAAVDAWQKLLTKAKIDVPREYVERIVCYPTDMIAGRGDCFVKVGRSKSLTVLDLKTGKIDYPHKIAVQLALYANAPSMCGELDMRGATEDFTDPPDIDKKHALVVHLPSPDEIDIVKIDIAAGYECYLKAIKPTIKWRRRKDLVSAFVQQSVVDPEAAASDEHVEMVRDRLSRIKAWDETPGHHSGVALTRARWPRSVPPRGPWTESDIDKLDQLLTNVERDASVPF